MRPVPPVTLPVTVSPLVTVAVTVAIEVPSTTVSYAAVTRTMVRSPSRRPVKTRSSVAAGATLEPTSCRRMPPVAVRRTVVVASGARSRRTV